MMYSNNIFFEQKKLLKKYITMQWIQKSYKTKWMLYLWILKKKKISDPHRLHVIFCKRKTCISKWASKTPKP